MRRKPVGLTGPLAALAGAALLAACDASQPSTSSTPPSRAHSTIASDPPSQKVSAASSQQGDPVPTIRLTVGGRAVNIELNDSNTAVDLLQQLPRRLRFRDYGGQEKTAALPAELSLAGVPAGSDARPGDVGYYAPGKVLVLYYEHVDYFAGIVRLGRMGPDDMGFIRDQLDGFEATLERA
jgi:hypothetical protein